MKTNNYQSMVYRQEKERKTSILTGQIEKLVNCKDFEAEEVIDVFLTCANKRGSYITEKETLHAFKDALEAEGQLVIGNMDMVQEYELKQFCKLKGIKL